MAERGAYPSDSQPKRARGVMEIRKVVDFTSATWNTAAVHVLFKVLNGFVKDAVLYARNITAMTSGGSATVEAGTLSDTDTFYTQDAYTDKDTAGAVWLASNLDSKEPDTSGMPTAQLVAEHVCYVIGTAALTGGQVEFIFRYTPVGLAQVTLGAGGATA